MQNLNNMAKMATNRPSTFLLQFGAEGVRKLRVYPAALVSIWRAENCPKWLKVEIEDLLETTGYRMMT